MLIKKKIKSEILLSKKNMRLDNFLREILFGKNGYYYKKNPIGNNKDFITSPEVSQVFGEIIGLYLFYKWKTKIKSEYNLIELGPGKGTLFKDISNAVSKYPDFLSSAKIIFIEINKELKKIQKKKIGELSIKNVSWEKFINFDSKKPSIIYSNEFFDCFPIRQFIFKDSWYEKYISFNKDNDSFYFIDKKINNSNLISFLNYYKKEKIFELSKERIKYFENICKLIKKNGGIFFTIDYGYFRNINNFSLQAIQNHKFSNVLENLGQKDISSHVNFKELLDIAKKNKLNIDEYSTQREFLKKYGILERKKYLSKLKNSGNVSNEIDRLINKDEMGKLFKCLVVSNL